MLSVRQNLVPSSKYSIKCPYSMVAEYITIHNTANDASAANEIFYMVNNNNQVSYHYAIDDKEIVQGILVSRNAWHCGDGDGNGNRKSIGIEICYSKSGGDRYVKAEELAVQFTAQLLFERKWGVERIKKHQDWNGKYCPHRILDNKAWGTFLNRVQQALNKLNNKGSELSVSQYNELLGKITALETAMTKKLDKVPTREVTATHKESWEWLIAQGITTGTDPQNYLTREQFATLLKKYHDKFVK